MITLRTILVALALTSSTSLALAINPIAAGRPTQSPLPMASTLFRQMALNGTTKPPGAALDDRRGTSMVLAAASLRLRRVVSKAICTGC